MNIVALIGVNSDRKDPINLDGLITVPRDPSAEGTGRKGASYQDETLFPGQI